MAAEQDSEIIPAEIVGSGLEVGKKEDLGANPLPTILHAKPTVKYPAEQHELRSIGGSTIFGSVMSALLGASYSAYQTYSNALESDFNELSVQTKANYTVWVTVSMYGMVICGVLFLASLVNVWRGIRAIKKSDKLLLLSEGRLIPVERDQIYPPTRWEKLKAKFYRKVIDPWIE